MSNAGERYRRSWARHQYRKPRVNLDNIQPRGQCDHCGVWTYRCDLKEQTDYRGGTAPVGLGFWVCPRCFFKPNPQGGYQYIAPDPEPVWNPRPSTYDFTVTNPTYANTALPDSALFVTGYQISVTGLDPEAVICYADGPDWRRYDTDEVVPRPAPVVSYYIDSATGNDLHTGQSLGQAWRTLAPVDIVAGGSIVNLVAGSVFTTRLNLGTPGLIFVKLGIGPDPLITGARQILGVAGDWTEVGTDGTTPTPGSNRWLKTISDGGASDNRLILTMNGVFPLQTTGNFYTPSWCQSTPANVNGVMKWRYQHLTSSGGVYRIWVYAVGNPTLFYSSLTVNSGGYGVDGTGVKYTMSNVSIQYWEYGYAIGDQTTLTDCRAQFIGSKAMHINGDGQIGIALMRPTIYDVGYTNANASGSGDEGIDINTPNVVVNLTVTDPNIGNIKEDCITMRMVDHTSICRIIGTAPNTARITNLPQNENALDWKSGNLVTDQAHFESYVVGAITVQIDSRIAALTNSLCNSPGINHPALSIAETNCSLQSYRSGYYSESSSVLLQRYTGQLSTSEFDVMVSNFTSGIVGIASVQSGSFFPTYSTFLPVSLLTTSRGVYYQNTSQTANVAAIEYVSGPTAGFFTYRFRATGVFQNFFGPGWTGTIAGLTGASAALNMTAVITDTYPVSVNNAPHYANFLVPESANPPLTVSIAGLSLTTIPFCNGLVGNAIMGTTQTLYAPVVASLVLPTPYGGNYVTGTGAAQAPVRRSNRDYTKAQVESNVVVNQNLINDTGGRWGGSAWHVDYNATPGTKFWAEIAVTSITIVSGVAFVVTAVAHDWSTNHKVCTYGGSPWCVNGWHWITVTSATEFNFPLPYSAAPDGVATGTIKAFDGTLAAGSAGLGSAPTVPTARTLDFQGGTIPASGRNNGAVQP